MDYSQERLGNTTRIADYSRDKSIRRGPGRPVPPAGAFAFDHRRGDAAFGQLRQSVLCGKAPTYYFVRQLAFAVLGMAAMLFFVALPMELLPGISMWVLLIAVSACCCCARHRHGLPRLPPLAEHRRHNHPALGDRQDRRHHGFPSD
jgi:hypothetical protein